MLEVLDNPAYYDEAVNMRDSAFSSLVAKARTTVEVIQGIYRENVFIMTLIENVSVVRIISLTFF